MQTTKEEQIGVHKGALITLLSEQQELARLLGIVNQLIQIHNNALKEMGIDFETELKRKVEEEMRKAQAAKAAPPQGHQQNRPGSDISGRLS